MSQREERVQVGSFPNRTTAELARVFLEEQGLAAVVTADDGGGSSPEVGFVTGGAALLVPASQEDRVREALAGLPEPRRGARPITRRHRVTAMWLLAVIGGSFVAGVVGNLVA